MRALVKSIILPPTMASISMWMFGFVAGVSPDIEQGAGVQGDLPGAGSLPTLLSFAHDAAKQVSPHVPLGKDSDILRADSPFFTCVLAMLVTNCNSEFNLGFHCVFYMPIPCPFCLTLEQIRGCELGFG